jgi:hypothetical protein
VGPAHEECVPPLFKKILSMSSMQCAPVFRIGGGQVASRDMTSVSMLSPSVGLCINIQSCAPLQLVRPTRCGQNGRAAATHRPAGTLRSPGHPCVRRNCGLVGRAARWPLGQDAMCPPRTARRWRGHGAARHPGKCRKAPFHRVAVDLWWLGRRWRGRTFRPCDPSGPPPRRRGDTLPR